MYSSLRFQLAPQPLMTKQYSLNMWVWAAQTLLTTALRNNLKTQNVTKAKENVDLTSYILLCLNNHNFRSFVDFIYIPSIDCFHITSRSQKTRRPKTTAKPCDHNNVYCFFIK